MTGPGGALDRLPSDARTRLDEFAGALDRVQADDLALFVARERQPRHRRAVEAAELVTTESGLVEVVAAARHAIVEAIIRELAERQFRVWIGGVAMAPNMGPVDQRVRLAQSLSDAVTAIVLDDRLDVADRDELLGLWSRLIA